VTLAARCRSSTPTTNAACCTSRPPPPTAATPSARSVFTEWQVRLDAEGIGGLDNSNTDSLRAYVDGKRFQGDPATIQLTAHRQISLVYGPRDATDDPAASYAFEQGE